MHLERHSPSRFGNDGEMDPWEKSETVNPEVRAYIYSLVSAVGGQDTLEDRYAIGDDAHAVLSDLIRWLRLFDEKTNRYDVKRCLAEANLVKGDLLEILAQWPESAQENRLKAKLAVACLQLLAPLTWPIELDAQKTTYNHLRHKPYIQLAQVGYKRAVLHFEDAPILRTVVRIGLPSMAIPRRERSKRDEQLLRMVLYFFRNIAMITQPQQLPSQGDENEISRSTTIEIFSQQEVFNLLLTIGSGAGDEFQDQDAVVLETLFHLLKGVDPKKLFMRQEQVVNEETNELQELMMKEKAMRSSYNKHAPTRHNRFGTMLWVKREDQKMSTVSGQNSITNERSMLQQMDTSKKWNKPKSKGKMTQEFSETSDFGMRVDLTEKARACLKTFVEDFLDSSFNPLFASLRKAIAGEADRLVEMNKRQYYYLISWFLAAEAARRDQVRATSGWQADRPSQTVEENTYAYIAAVLDQETFVLLSRQMQSAYDNKEWQDLQSCLLCFTQILLTVQSMADSQDEEDQEIAENIQSRIFYEEATHDLLLQILRGYTNQGFAYLDAVTECVHVFVRMLEQYAKQNVDLQIRSKRRARKKQKKAQQPTINEDNDDANNENAVEAENDEQEAFRTVRERKFDFARLTAKLLNQGSVNTYISFLLFYADLTPAQLKRCHRFFYRLAFKNDLAVLLFRVDILALFQRIIKGSDGLRQDIEGYREWEELVRQVFRRCIKWIEREPADGADKDAWREAAVVEVLFSKVPATMFYLENGFDRVIEKRAPRPPAEMEVKASLEEAKRVGVVVSLLLEQGKGDAIEWVKRELKSAVEERQAWLDGNSTRSALAEEGREGNDVGASNVESPPAPTIFLSHDTKERKEALFKDKFLRLFLDTLGCQRLGAAEDTDASWILPSEVTPEQLKEALEKIQTAEHDGVELEEGKTALDCIRNKSSVSRHSAFEPDTDESEGDLDAPLFPPNLREKRKADDGEEAPKKRRRLTKRNQKELTEEELQEKAKQKSKREREKNAKIKSALFVTESDDESDEEGDAEFFRLEEERRKKTSKVIRKALLQEAKRAEEEGEGGDGKRGKKGKKSKKAEGASKKSKPDDNDDEDVAMLDEEEPSRRTRSPSIAISSDEDESDASDEPPAAQPTKKKTQSRRVSSDDDLSDEVPTKADWHTISDEDEDASADEEEETPSTSPPAFPLGEVSGNAAKAIAEMNEGQDEDDDEPPIKAPALTAGARRRPAFIVEDDSDED